MPQHPGKVKNNPKRKKPKRKKPKNRRAAGSGYVG